MNDYVHSLRQLKLRFWTVQCQERFKFGASDAVVLQDCLFSCQSCCTRLAESCEFFGTGEADAFDWHRHSEGVRSSVWHDKQHRKFSWRWRSPRNGAARKSSWTTNGARVAQFVCSRHQRHQDHRVFENVKTAHVELSRASERFTDRNPWILPISSLRIDREQHVPDSSNHSLYLLKLFSFSCPEGTLRGERQTQHPPTHHHHHHSLPPLPPTHTTHPHDHIHKHKHQHKETHTHQTHPHDHIHKHKHQHKETHTKRTHTNAHAHTNAHTHRVLETAT